MPSIFTDQTFAKCFHMCLSTSQVFCIGFCNDLLIQDILLQVPFETMLLSGFGPVVPDGYGVCYNPQEKRLLFAISSFKKCHETDTTKFATKLFEALHQIKNIIEIQSPTAKL